MEYSTIQYSLYLTEVCHLSDQGLHLQSIYRELFCVNTYIWSSLTTGTEDTFWSFPKILLYGII